MPLRELPPWHGSACLWECGWRILVNIFGQRQIFAQIEARGSRNWHNRHMIAKGQSLQNLLLTSSVLPRGRRSVLFRRMMKGVLRLSRRSSNLLSCWLRPSSLSTTKRGYAGLGGRFDGRIDRKFSTVSVILARLLTPAVSTKTYSWPSFSKRTSTLSRVVPATSETIILSWPEIALISEDLPAFGRPSMQRRRPGFFEVLPIPCRLPAAWPLDPRTGRLSGNHVLRIRPAGKAKSMKFRHLLIFAFQAINLVDHAKHGHVLCGECGPPNAFVKRQKAVLAVNNKSHGRRPGKGLRRPGPEFRPQNRECLAVHRPHWQPRPGLCRRYRQFQRF